ncbi:hypothetical protein CDD83_420 [Cordyceps sp. RAO-2017]|nr:hypothetical protein CDD83_420 [Cordyceps sp. RAO-2017]
MDASHVAYQGHSDVHGPSAADIANISLDFDAMMASDGALSQSLGPFEPCIHDESCLDHHQHLWQPRSGDKLQANFTQQLHPAGSLSMVRGQDQAHHHQDPSRALTTSPPLQQQHSQASYAWENFLNESALDNSPLPDDFAFGREDDCASECSSACEGTCPSQCGDTDHVVCCDDDTCGTPQLCLDEACQGAGRPCMDESCLSETATPDKHTPPGHAVTDRDKAAAAALASFGDNQLQMIQADFVHPPAPPPSAFRDAPMCFVDLPASLPCVSLSTESLLSNGSPSFPNQPLQMAFEYALANHIMQYHDPSHGLAHSGSCIANDPSQFISRCTLPKFHPTDDNADPYLPQLQSHECGFPVQDPNAFAHHIFQEHRPALMVHAQQSRLPAAPHAGAHAAVNAPHQPAPRLDCPSLSTTPSSLATPSPFESDAGLAEFAPSRTPQSPAHAPKPQVLAQEDQFLCRWMVDDEANICGRRFDNDEQLQRHCKFDHLKQLKKARVGFRCGWANCTRNTCFTQRSKLERHMQVHTGYKPVHCDICGAALSAKQALDQHMRIHTGETPWVCKFPGCGCAFKQQSALTMHERTHTGDKPLECEICHKRFSESSNLSKHRRTHNVKGMHECQLCGKDFHRLDQLRRHMGTNHKDRPAEVDALLNKAKPKFQAQRVSKPAKPGVRGRARPGLDPFDVDTLELIEDQLQGVIIDREP